MSGNLPKISNLPKINKTFNAYHAGKASTNDATKTPIFGTTIDSGLDGFSLTSQIATTPKFDINTECFNVLNNGGSASNPFRFGEAAKTAPLFNFAQAANTGEIGVLNNSNTNKTNNSTIKNSSEKIDLANATTSQINTFIKSFKDNGSFITSNDLNALMSNVNLDKSQLEGLYNLALEALDGTSDKAEKGKLQYLMKELEDRITGESEWQETLDKIKNAGTGSATPAGGAAQGGDNSSGGGGGTVDNSIQGLENQLPTDFDGRLAALQQMAQGTPLAKQVNKLAEGAKADKTAAQEKEAQGKETQTAAQKAQENADKADESATESDKKLTKKQTALKNKNGLVAQKQTAFNTAKTAESTAQQAHTEAQLAVKAAETAYNAASAEEKAYYKATLEQAQNRAAQAKTEHENTKQTREAAEKELKTAQDERDKIAKEIKELMDENKDLKASQEDWKKTAETLTETSNQQMSEAQDLTKNANNKLQEMETLLTQGNMQTAVQNELADIMKELNM